MTRRSPEHALQVQVAQFLRLCMPPGTNWTAIDHSNTSRRHGAMLMARGVKSGVPDFHFTLHNGRTAWIELKSAKGRLSPGQVEFLFAEQEAGALWAVCRSVEAVQKHLQLWGVKLRGVVGA
jgi:hypothetical protein